MASDLITVDALRDHVETDLADDALGRLIDDADAEIVRRFGPHNGERVEAQHLSYPTKLIFLPRPASAVASITEESGAEGATVETVADSKYSLEDGGRSIRRKDANWKRVVNVTYTPESDDARRAMVLVDLVKLETEYEGIESRRVGSYSETKLDLEKERGKILNRLRQPYGGAGLLA